MWEFREITNRLSGDREDGEASTTVVPPIRRAQNFAKTMNPLNPCSMMMGENYFSADGDDDVSKTASYAQKLSWRGDPSQTYSDWTIVVETGGNEFDTRTYHVHKSILSVGPRSSKYFAKLFSEQTRHYSGNTNQITQIELDQQDADCFPLFLDFMYDTHENNDDDSLSLVVGDEMTTANAVSLRHLARIFDCEGLILAVNKFIQKDLSLKTGPVYLTQAYYYQDSRLIESSKRLCVENFGSLQTRALTRLPLDLFRELLLAVHQASKTPGFMEKFDEDGLSYQLSEVVYQYFEKNPEALSIDLLLELTRASFLPRMAPEPAIGFTAMAKDLNLQNIDPDSIEWRGLVDLCKRCSEAVVGEYGWKDFSVEEAVDQFLYGPCTQEKSSMDSLLFATSFAAALQKAQGDYKGIAMSTGNWKQQLHDLRKENSELQQQHRQAQNEIDRHKRILADTKEELLMLKEQVKQLRSKPLPPVARQSAFRCG